MPSTAAKRTIAKAKAGLFNAPKTDGPTVIVRTPNVAGAGRPVDAAKYAAMREVLLKVMPRKAPGFTQSAMMAAVLKAAPKDVFPKTTSYWWAKCVQLDLETKGELAREKTTPVRWHKA